MSKLLSKQRNILFLIGVLIFLVLLITILSPVEETLGKSVRLVYVHGSLTWVAIIIYTCSAVLGLVNLVTNRNISFQWSLAFGYTSLLVWMINFLLSLLAMSLIWGRIIWGEPRMIMTTVILFFSLFIFLISLIFEKPKLICFLNLLLGFILWISLIRTKVVVHPLNAITSSASPTIKIYFGLMTLFLFNTAGLISILVRNRLIKTVVPR